MRFIHFTYCLLLLVLFPFLLKSQPAGKSFRALFSAGIVGSQVDGDTYGGYHKAGAMLGLGVNKALSEKLEIEFTLSYIQKGSRKNADPNNNDFNFYLFRLNYIEIPLLLKYNYKKLKFEAGLSYAYLFNYSEESMAAGYYNSYPPKKTDWNYSVGMGYKLSDRLIANFRYSYSFVPFRDYNAQGVYLGTFWTRIFNKGLYNNLVVLSLNYLLQPKTE